MKTRAISHLALSLLFFIIAGTAHAVGMLDSVVSAAESASNGWMNTSLNFAKNLFFGLAAIEFIWAAVQLTFQRGEISEIVSGLLMKIIAISFFSMMLMQAPTWIPAIIDSFKQAGAAVGGNEYKSKGSSVNGENCTADVLSPSAVIDQGVCVATKLQSLAYKKMGISGDSPGITDVVRNFAPVLTLGLACLAIVIGFVILAVQLAITLIESYIVVGGGVLMLGFLGSRWTINYGERYFGYAVSIGAKLFTLYLIIGFGNSFVEALVNYIADDIASRGNLALSTLLGTAGGALTYGAIGFLVPSLAGSMLNGTPSMSMSNVGQAAKGVASSPVVGALAGTAAAAHGSALGARGVGWLMAKFGEGAGSISGHPFGSGSGGSVSGSLKNFGDRLSSGASAAFTSSSSLLSGGGAGMGGASTRLSSRSLPGLPGGSSGSRGLPSGFSESGSLPSSSTAGTSSTEGSRPGFTQRVSESGSLPSSSSGTTEGSRSGFTSHKPRSFSYDPDRRDFDQYNPSQDNGQKQGKGIGELARKLENLSRELQYASYRYKTGFGHDGNPGGAPGARLNI